MANFNNTLEYWDLQELECRGPIYTWNNGRDGEEFTKERLDRVVAN
jgi:hypothetical protein